MKNRPSSTKPAPTRLSRDSRCCPSQADRPSPASIWPAGAMTAPWASGASVKPVMNSSAKPGPASSVSIRPRPQPMPARSRQPQRHISGSVSSAPGAKRSRLMSAGLSPAVTPSRASTE